MRTHARHLLVTLCGSPLRPGRCALLRPLNPFGGIRHGRASERSGFGRSHGGLPTDRGRGLGPCPGDRSGTGHVPQRIRGSVRSNSPVDPVRRGPLHSITSTIDRHGSTLVPLLDGSGLDAAPPSAPHPCQRFGPHGIRPLRSWIGIWNATIQGTFEHCRSCLGSTRSRVNPLRSRTRSHRISYRHGPQGSGCTIRTLMADRPVCSLPLCLLNHPILHRLRYGSCLPMVLGYVALLLPRDVLHA